MGREMEESKEIQKKGKLRERFKLHMTKKQLWTMIISTVVFIILTALIAIPLLQTVKDPEAFREQIASKGIWGRVVFVLLNITQVIFAFIPGGPFSIAAGYAFGVVDGVVLCLIATTIGSVIVFLAVRALGQRFTEYFISFDEINELEFMRNSNHLTMILLLVFLIPGTPKDPITYAAGFTKLPLANWVFINLIQIGQQYVIGKIIDRSDEKKKLTEEAETK